ncbi:alginate lyase family protein [Bacteroides stercorirosoris]|uniref:Alginate lyase n=1 Tax=Bacteroides stercorirosoris TaxID=871324 RepID=A0A1M6BIC6_9BACE|nr:alginate lyase family protein [Bacteroides stercorirosoris]SHI48530.1 Alginate lyase [Bacteroides stercorirosoris]
MKNILGVIFLIPIFLLTGSNKPIDAIYSKSDLSESELVKSDTFLTNEYTPSLEHPGILHNTKSIERMRTVVHKANATDPAYQTYLLMRNDYRAKSDYQLKGPYEYIARQKDYAWTKRNYEADFGAAYLNALMWIITQDESHATKVMEILTKYADKLKGIPNHNDAMLLAGFHAFQIAFALEMVSTTYDKIQQTDVDKVNNMLRNVFLPWLDNFYSIPPFSNGNWGLIVSRAYMGLAILWNDTEMYKKTIKFVLNGYDNGSFPKYIDEETGQCQESGRDQAHVQLGIGAAGSICEIAYKQGNDLYSALNNLVMKGYEYTAKFNVGHNNVPFKTWTDVTGKYSGWNTISPKARGNYRSIYGLAYNHYVIRKGLNMPYTKEMLDKNNWLGKFDGDCIDFDVFQFNDKDLNN